eukprot:5945043-Pleurochrysis_carterae.AAC.1
MDIPAITMKRSRPRLYSTPAPARKLTVVASDKYVDSSAPGISAVAVATQAQPPSTAPGRTMRSSLLLLLCGAVATYALRLPAPAQHTAARCATFPSRTSLPLMAVKKVKTVQARMLMALSVLLTSAIHAPRFTLPGDE